MYMAHVGDWNFWIFVRQMLENTFPYVYYTYWNSARTPAMQHMKGVLPEFLDMCMAHVGNPPELLHKHWKSTGTSECAYYTYRNSAGTPASVYNTYQNSGIFS